MRPHAVREGLGRTPNTEHRTPHNRCARMDVKRGPILFRCDATPASYEPLYQCLAFAAALQRRRRGTHFFSYLAPLSLVHTISRGNNDCAPAEIPLGEPGDLNATLAQVRKMNAAAIVLAGRAVSNEYVQRLRDAGTLTLAFDSRTSPTLAVDL